MLHDDDAKIIELNDVVFISEFVEWQLAFSSKNNSKMLLKDEVKQIYWDMAELIQFRLHIYTKFSSLIVL